ncbi:MAG TPA: histidinol dehydrogenase [Cyclobacteriaceae bacterium]|nr:histidinol dehydrogenase [Cyclobacteriaceae bacterium]
MNVIYNPQRDTWKTLCTRPQIDREVLDPSIRRILEDVRTRGDQALIDLTLEFDGVRISAPSIGADEIARAESSLDAALTSAMQVAARNIEAFHASQRQDPKAIETMPGVTCWRKGVPIDSVGIYIPGGSAPLFSTVLMLGIPARLAGCSDVILCTPPDKQGRVNPAILYAAQLAGITKIFKVGGAQAIAAMAYGTASVPAVYKIFGPGNQFVTRAKQLVSEEGVAIDMPAGPSEVLVLADATANPVFIAADLLSQAEHGPDSQVMLVALNEVDTDAIQTEVDRQLNELPRRDVAARALENSRVVIFDSMDMAMRFSNAYAPEHLIINTANAASLAGQVTNAGSVFIGAWSPEAAGDYASGTNHTLPTNGYARAFAGVSLDSFLKYITFQEITTDGIKAIGPVVERMAEAESLQGHKAAITKRLEYLNKN